MLNLDQIEFLCFLITTKNCVVLLTWMLRSLDDELSFWANIATVAPVDSSSTTSRGFTPFLTRNMASDLDYCNSLLAAAPASVFRL